jgi:glycosyltransferase involved in cell wall biosynthesis
MRILLTVHQFFPQFAAGTEVLTYSVARELVRRGHLVHILAGYPGDASLADESRFDEYDYEGIHVYRFHHAYTPMGRQVSMIEIGGDNHVAAAYFDRILKDFQPDLVHSFHLNRLGTGLIERAFTAGVPRFMTLTDFWMLCPMSQLFLTDGSFCSGPNTHGGNCLKHFAENTQKGLVGKIVTLIPTIGADLLVRLTKAGVLPDYPQRSEVLAIGARMSVNVGRLNKLNRVIVPNRFMKDFLVRHGVMPDLITEASFGVDVVAGERSEFRSSHQGALRVAFIGTLGHYKGCHILIEAFRMLPVGSATLKIYGRPEDFPDYSEQLHMLASQHPDISFCGTFPNSSIAQVLADVDVLVVPSLWYENTPLVLYSAQAAACPVIASDVPGLAAVIEHDDNGLLFESGSSPKLAQQLTRLMNEEGLLRRLSANARTPKSTEKYVEELLIAWESGM